jgi:hypothetical protein
MLGQTNGKIDLTNVMVGEMNDKLGIVTQTVQKIPGLRP